MNDDIFARGMRDVLATVDPQRAAIASVMTDHARTQTLISSVIPNLIDPGTTRVFETISVELEAVARFQQTLAETAAEIIGRYNTEAVSLMTQVAASQLEALQAMAPVTPLRGWPPTWHLGMNAVLESLRPGLALMNDTFGRAIRSFVPPLDTMWVDWLDGPLRDWQQRKAGMTEHDRRLARALAEADWWFSPSWTYALVDNLVRSIHTRGRRLPLATARRTIDRILLRHYRARGALSRMAASWTQPEFTTSEPRSAVKRALKDFRAGRYYSVVNALVPVIERVLTEYAIRIGHLVGDAAVRRAKPNVLYSELRLNADVVPGPGLENEFARLFGDFEWSRAPKSNNRHALAHGRRIARNSATEALRILLVLDTLNGLISLQR